MPALFEPPHVAFEFAARHRTDGRRSPALDDSLARIRRGVYVRESEWTGLDPAARYRAFILATLACSPTSPLLSHLSAAVLWGLPVIGAWPNTVHTTILDQSGGRSSGLYTRHRTSIPPEVALLEGVRCTTLPRTVADIARAGSRATALAMVDSILRDGRADRAELLAADAALGVGRGSRQSRALLLLGSEQAANGGESLVRLLLHDAGLEAPSLQFRIDDSGGLVGYADFAWPERGVVLEFDGRRKYTEQRFLEGRTSDEVLWQEKRREDRIRAVGWMVVRVVWEDLQGSSPRLLRLIAEAGIPRRRQIGFEGAR